MNSPSVEPECIMCGGSSCQDQYLLEITAKGKASFKSLIADDTQLVQKFEHYGVQNMLQRMLYFTIDHVSLIDYTTANQQPVNEVQI